jgi:hypothetical protein
MNSTADLIKQLSAEGKLTTPLRAPSYFATRLFLLLAGYMLAAQAILGFREDILVQLERPFFTLEILLLAFLLITSSVACILAMYPDAYQKPWMLKLPYTVFALLLGLTAIQFLLPQDARMVMPEAGSHTIECSVYIAIAALVPSAVMVALIRKGASIRQFHAGAFAVLAASAIGCLTLRLAEPIDPVMHLVCWHYLPTLLFASLGAVAGKYILKW